MKKYAMAITLVLIGAPIATSFVDAQSQAGLFRIEVKANGTVELMCTKGCNFKKLSWTCDESNQDKECTVTMDESGMTSP